MAVETSVKLVVPSELRLVDLVHEAAQKLAEVAGLEPDDALNMGLAVREATINAMKHGNRMDRRRNVDLAFEVHRDEFRAKIRDQGNGFDPDANPDPTAAENVLLTSGRGILMIRAFVDDVEFRFRENRGMEVTLIKKLHPSARVAEGRS